jgi:hypothetical protein
MLGAALSASFQNTNAKSTASYRSNSNVGATISRQLHIATIENMCTSKKYIDISKYATKSRKQAEKVLALLDPGSYATKGPGHENVQLEVDKFIRLGVLLP